MQGVPCEIVVTDVAHHSWALCSWTVQLKLSMGDNQQGSYSKYVPQLIGTYF